jgi:beta-lactamase regulating signal transducer with metallopeptidase domain
MQVSELLNTEIFKALGWTIIHSMWQSLILFLVLKCVLLVIRKENSSYRYVSSLAILSSIVLCTFFTFFHEYKLFIGDGVDALKISGGPSGNHLKIPVHNETGVNVSGPGWSLGFLDFLNNISPYITLVWIIGMFFSYIRIINANFYLNKLRKLTGEIYINAGEKLEELCTRVNMHKKIKLIITAEASEPITFGHFKPVILLPLNYTLQVPMEQLEMILAHELSHIRRSDYLVNFFQSIAEAVYFFNPFFQSISGIVRQERECCCDDMASEICGNKKTMAIALANLKISISHPELALSAAPVQNQFSQRIHRLIYPAPHSKFSIKYSFYGLLLLTVIIISMTKCMRDHNRYNNLPESTNSFTQLLTDNQADHKIEILSYQKSNKDHEIFLVSTLKGNPLYAYLDGSVLPADELKHITDILYNKKTISEYDLMNMAPGAKKIRTNGSMQLNQEVESIYKIIIETKKKLTSGHSISLEKKLDSLNKQSSIRTDQIINLAMEDYKEDVKYIPVDVQLHEILTRIIVNKEYTPDDRKKLDELLRKKQTL